MTRVWIAGLFSVAVVLLSPLDARAQGAREGLVEEPIRVPGTVFGSKVTFDALLVRPAGNDRFPLAVITHGSSGDATFREAARPVHYATPAYELARRGWATVIFMRLGYGATGGHELDAAGRCTNPQYEDPALATGEQFRAALESLRGMPFVDGQRMIAIGISGGGFGTLALTTLPVDGLRAVINFAGGRGSNAKGEICSPAELARITGRFGARSKVPSLWIYAENDKWFVPAVVKSLFAAYTGGGGKAELLTTPPSGDDGHGLMARTNHVNFWAPTLDTFLRANGLPTWSPDALRLDTTASDRVRNDLPRYLAAGGEKALAISPSGAFGWRSTRNTTEEAKRGAIENCAKDGAKDCRLVFVNFERAK